MEALNFPITNQEFVGSLIPQKWPFVMVDSILEYSDKEITSQFTIPETSLFNDKGVFNASGLIENMAQTVALHTGYDYFLRNEIAPTGYIGAIKKVVVFNRPLVHSIIKTKVEILHEIMGVTLVKAQVVEGGNIIATAEMKTVLEK